MFTAYFDASGNAERPDGFLVVSGYLANYLQWKTFEDMWKETHREYGAALPFHMSEFIAATAEPDRYAAQKNARSDYVALSKEQRKAEKFFWALCMAQLTMLNCGISCILDMRIYADISSLLDLRKVVPPYALGARSCMAAVHEWEDRFGAQNPVECIFAQGDLEQGKFTELVTSEGGNAPIFKHTKDYAGLQAADLYAWEQSNYLKRERTGRHLPARGAFKSLLNFIPCMHLEVTQQGLINLCHAKKIDPRTGISFAKHETQ